MAFNPALPANGSQILSPELRSQFNGLKDLIDAVSAGPLLLIQRKIGAVQSLASGVTLDPVVFDAVTFAPLGAGGTFDGGTFTASATGVFRFSYRLAFNDLANSGPAGVRCVSVGSPGVGDLLFAGLVNGAALTAGFGLAVISFSETLALTSGDTYRITALQFAVAQLDINGGEVVIERLG